MPSEKSLAAKQAKVEQLTETIKGSCAGVLVDYKGITVEEDTKLRKELREAGVIYTVEKNTMLARVSKDDQTAPARILGKFAGEHDNKFNLKAGFVDGELYDEKGVTALSKIPSKDVLLAQLVGSLQGPMQKLAATLQALQEKKASEDAA